jgi:hypothetical protein
MDHKLIRKPNKICEAPKDDRKRKKGKKENPVGWAAGEEITTANAAEAGRDTDFHC